MATSPLNRVIQHVLADVGPDGAEMTDGELLTRFLRSRDSDALAALVRRHASMVWGVCCRLLQNQQDAEDAFQATFVVLVRKAADVPRQAVANWLFGVARQTAVRLRATSAKRRQRESQVVNMPEPSVAENRADLHRVLDEELSRLPNHYRGVIVLCDLEDLTRKEAAAQLGIPEGTVASRLVRARAMLAKRLTRRGVALAAGSIAAAGSATSAPPALVDSTIRVATQLAAGHAAGVVSASVASLADGVVKAMFISKLKAVPCVLALATLVVLGGATLVPGHGQPAGETPMEKPPDKQAQQQVPKTQTVRGKVLDDATGKPINKFTVYAEKFDPANPNFDPSDPRKAFSGRRETSPGNADGTFLTTVRWAAGWTARVGADGYLSQPVLTSAPLADKAEINVTIRLKRPPAKVRGVVLDHTGKPVKDAAVFAVGQNGLNLFAGAAWSRGWPGENRKEPTATPVMTDEQGRFELPTAGARVLGVSHPSFDAWPTAIPASGEVTIRLPKPARVEIKLDIDGAGTACSIYYKDLSDVPLPESGFVQISRSMSIPNPGHFILDAMPPGKFQLYRCGAGGRILDQHIFDLKPGESKTIDYVRSKGARIRGKVTWAKDLKPQGIIVSIHGEESFKGPFNSTWQRTYTSINPAADGTFLTERIPPGTYQLIAYAFAPLTEAQKFRTGAIAASFHAEPKRIVVPDKGELKVDDLVLKANMRKAATPNQQPGGGLSTPASDPKPAAKTDAKEKLKLLIDQVLAAHGGEEKLKKLQFTMTAKHSNGETQKYFVQPPKHFRWETTRQDSTSKRIVILFPEGRRWWTKEPNQAAKEFIPTGIEPAMEYWLDNVKFFGPRQVLRLKDADHKVTLLDDEIKIGDRQAVGIEVTGPFFKGKMYFDKETHLLAKRTADSYYRSNGFIVYSDYKKFDGIPVAQTEHDGYFEPKIIEFTVVEKLDAKLFEKP